MDLELQLIAWEIQQFGYLAKSLLESPNQLARSNKFKLF